MSPEAFTEEGTADDTSANWVVIAVFLGLAGIPTLFAIIPLLLNSKLPKKIALDQSQ